LPNIHRDLTSLEFALPITWEKLNIILKKLSSYEFELTNSLINSYSKPLDNK
jgi:hypothetical protein